MTSTVESSIDVGDAVVQVDTAGDGPDFVIIHSLLTGPEAFDRVAASLAARHTVHRVYLPGFGRSTPLTGPEPSIADLADHVAATMSGLGCGPDATVLGNGLGSFVALALAVRHGSGFRRLIASNTGPGFPDDRKGAFTNMSNLAEGGGMQAVADVAIQRIFPQAYLEAHPEVPDERRAVLEGVDPSAFAAACRALAVLDLSGDLPAIANPTLVIVGEIDQTTPPELGGEVAEAIPDARLTAIPGCGHCPQLEKPEALIQAIEDFVDRHAG
jgi:pimeloyl-ACP methyl ester carboxylesterase